MNPIVTIKNGVLEAIHDAGGSRLVIPDGVTEIADNLYCPGIVREITLPDGVTRVGEGAFSSIYLHLKKISIPASVQTIGKGAFGREEQFAQNITITVRLKSLDELRSWCEHAPGLSRVEEMHFLLNGEEITELVIPEGVTRITDSAFSHCLAFTSVTLPESLVEIASSAFFDCRSLPTITLPDSLNSIGDGAFGNCINLRSITVPDTVGTIGGNAFASCGALTSVILPAGLKELGRSMFYGCTSLPKIDLPDGIEVIGKFAFNGCTVLEEIGFPKGLVAIEDYAFSDCKKLSDIILPEGVRTIGEEAFHFCDGLTSVTLPDSIRSIGADAFSKGTYQSGKVTLKLNIADLKAWCTTPKELPLSYYTSLTYLIHGENVKDLVIPEGVETIREKAFCHFTSLETVTLPQSLKSIGNMAFHGCTSLRETVFGENLEEVGAGAFSRCTSLVSLTLPKYCKRIGYKAFSGCSSLRSAVLPETLAEIESEAFKDCTSLEEITLPAAVKTIGMQAFYHTAICGITVPEADCWGESAFAYCKHLKSATLLDNYLPERIFYDCSDLESLTLTKALTGIGDEALTNTGITALTITADCQNFGKKALPEDLTLTVDLSDHDLFRLCQSPLRFPENLNRRYRLNGKPITELVIPDGVETIAAKAFMRAVDLRSVTVPASVRTIEALAFFGCPSLKAVNLPDTDIVISDIAFDDIRLPPYPDDPDSFTHCYRFSKASSRDTVDVKGVGSFGYVTCTKEEADAMIPICNGWKLEYGTRSYTDYSGTDFEWSQDGYPDYTVTYKRLYPRHALVKDGEVIGFFCHGKALTFTEPHQRESVSDYERFSHCTDTYWRLIKR